MNIGTLNIILLSIMILVIGKFTSYREAVERFRVMNGEILFFCKCRLSNYCSLMTNESGVCIQKKHPAVFANRQNSLTYFIVSGA